jgi:hypothetical protein
MKQQQKLTANLTLVVALIGLSPVIATAADSARTSDGPRGRPAVVQDEARSTDSMRSGRSPGQLKTRENYRLSLEQMDQVHAGSIYDVDLCLGLCSTPMTLNIGPGGCMTDRSTGGCMQL